MYSPVFLLFILTCFTAYTASQDVDNDSEPSYYKIEGKVHAPDHVLLSTPSTNEWLTSTKVLVNGGEHIGFLRADGTFVVNSLPSGSYVVEISNPNFFYEPARVDITSRGKMRARKVNYLQNSAVMQMSYPLKFRTKGQYKYFQIRETMKVTDFLFNPMVLMMVMPLLLIMVLPKVMNTEDNEAQREMQQSLQMPKFDIPELSEMMTSWFTGSSGSQKKGRDRNSDQTRNAKAMKKRS
ncbi:RNF14 (predicted) [Pycnogonum litorale]